MNDLDEAGNVQVSDKYSVDVFEKKGTDLSKKVFSGHDVSERERDFHNVYWQYVQVLNKGLHFWVLDCEKDEYKSTLTSLKSMGLGDIIDLSEKASESKSQSSSDESGCSGCGSEDTNMQGESEEFTLIDKRYEDLKTRIQQAALSHLE